MVKKHLTPFSTTLFDSTILDIIVPEDLQDYITLGANIHRYKYQDNSYDHIFDDTVDEHTKRMVLYAASLSLPEDNKKVLTRTLWIHDIPEIIDSQTAQSDMTTIDKIRYPDQALATKAREEAIMEEIFSKEDRDLYDAFEPAKEMLFTGKIDFAKTTPVALIACVLDTLLESTNSFQGFITEYLLNDGYDPSLPFPLVDSFEYCFQRNIDVYNTILALDHPEYTLIRGLILEILQKDMFGFIDKIWTPQALLRLPDYAYQEYEKFIQRRLYFTTK